MPGKYPVIVSPPGTRTSITPGPGPDGLATGTVLSQSDREGLAKMFPNSPIYRYRDDGEYRAFVQPILQPAVQAGDLAHFGPEGVNLDYADAPDLSTPPDGFDSSYYPNLIANPDPAGGEGTATGSPLSPNDNFGTGATVNNVLPSATAAVIAQTNITVSGPIAPLGQSGANLESGTVTTHDINEGAVSRS